MGQKVQTGADQVHRGPTQLIDGLLHDRLVPFGVQDVVDEFQLGVGLEVGKLEIRNVFLRAGRGTISLSPKHLSRENIEAPQMNGP